VQHGVGHEHAEVGNVELAQLRAGKRARDEMGDLTRVRRLSASKRRSAEAAELRPGLVGERGKAARNLAYC